MLLVSHRETACGRPRGSWTALSIESPISTRTRKVPEVCSRMEMTLSSSLAEFNADVSRGINVSFSTFITVEQLADRFQINRFTVYHWLKTEPERLPRPSRLFGRILFSEAAIAAFVANPPPAREERRGRKPGPQKVGQTKKGRGRPTKASRVASRSEGGAQ